MGIVVDFILIAIVVINVWLGHKKGLINVVFNIFATLIAIIATLVLYKPVSNIIMDNTEIDNKIREVIISNNKTEENEEVKDEEEKGNGKVNNIQKYITKQIENAEKSAKEQAIESIADELSEKAVYVLTGIIVFIVIRIALILLKFLSETLASLPIIKQFNELGGIIYGLLKSVIIIYVLLTIIFIMSGIYGNNVVTDAISESYLTKFVYDNNIIVNYCLLDKNLL